MSLPERKKLEVVNKIMKLTRLIKLIILFSFTVSYAQSDTGNYYNNIFYTCKVWGYLKYFHTSLADGHIDWDKALLDNLPNLRNINTKQEFNNYLNIYFNIAGAMQIPLTNPLVIPDSLRYNLNTDWFVNNCFSDSTTSFLQDIQDKFRPGSNYYVYSIPEDGEPKFNTDIKYYDIVNNTTQELRFLGLFRYWNIINYFYPYKNLLDKNWDDVLKEMIPKIIHSTDEISYHRTILELAANLNDAHAFTSSPIISGSIQGNIYIPLIFKYINGSTIISKVGTGVSDLKPGDIIKKINGVSIEELRLNLRPVTYGSNPASLERNINFYLTTFLLNQSVALEIENEKGVLQVSLPTMDLTNYLNSFPKNVPAWTKINRNGKKLGIINMDVLQDSQIQSMFNELWDSDALIFDIRNYPNVTMSNLFNYLFPGPIMIARFTAPDVKYSGTLYWMSDTEGGGAFIKHYTNRIYLLLNEDTQSYAEYMIMALGQHPMAVKIGSQTAGADGNVSEMYLPGNIAADFTGLGTFYPDYTPTQRIGIVPDVNVIPTIEGIRAGRDEVMEAAFNHYFGISYIKQEKIIPSAYSLSQNYPNPFNPTTSISFSVAKASFVTLKVYDIVGKEVADLISGQKDVGIYKYIFDASKLSSGVYFYKLQAGDFTDTKKMILIR
jgi:carboxyl-terminal processing protease